jgi:hypothetical protein
MRNDMINPAKPSIEIESTVNGEKLKLRKNFECEELFYLSEDAYDDVKNMISYFIETLILAAHTTKLN